MLSQTIKAQKNALYYFFFGMMGNILPTGRTIIGVRSTGDLDLRAVFIASFFLIFFSVVILCKVHQVKENLVGTCKYSLAIWRNKYKEISFQ